MKKLLSLFLILLTAGTALAQNSGGSNEQTSMPVLSYERIDDYAVMVTITATDDDADIFYRYSVNGNYNNLTVYDHYDGPILFEEPGYYVVEAFATAPGKDPSNAAVIQFEVLEPPVPTEQTEAPVIYVTSPDDMIYIVEILNSDPVGADIFYKVGFWDDSTEDFTYYNDFQPYAEPLVFADPGSYMVEAYAIAPEKLQSETVMYTIFIPERPEPPAVTEAPVFYGYVIDVDGKYAGYRVELIPSEPSEIYYRTLVSSDEDFYDWTELTDWAMYTAPLDFRTDGHYRIEAYAVTEGKERSYDCAYEFVVEMPEVNYDFEEDGIFYRIIGDGMVSVTSETTNDYNTSYSGDVVIPDFVTHDGVTYQVCAIAEKAFYGCPVSSVTIGDCVTTIGERAFCSCDALTEVVLGDYVIEVGNSAFYSCNSLSKLTIGSGVARIGNYAFYSCPLTDVICKPATPPVMAGSYCFGCYNTATLHVHPAVANSYRATDYWNRFGNIVAEKKVAPAPGDVNGDGQLNVSDVTTILNSLMNAN